MGWWCWDVWRPCSASGRLARFSFPGLGRGAGSEEEESLEGEPVAEEELEEVPV